MFDTLAQLVPKPRGLPDRAWHLDVLRRVLDGTIYDLLTYDFHQERSGANEYIPVSMRRPSVRYALPRLVVEDSVSFLFGEGRFPAVECADKAAQETLATILTAARAMDVFTLAATRGSVGSIAIQFRVLNGRVFLDALDTDCLTPEWDPAEPDTLKAVHEAYQIKGSALKAAGYPIRDKDLPGFFWFRRSWTADAELWFRPQSVEDAVKGRKPTEDSTRSVHHGLGFVPMVWVRNLPGGLPPDGACTFRAAIETSIEIDYQLSQAGRGLKYSSDPLLLLKEPAAPDAQIARSASTALVVDKDGDAKLLEISGSAAGAVVEYVRALRELALESVHGNRANADRLGAAQSGRAMELLYAPLLNLVDRLRASYGRALLDVAHMVVRTAGKYPLRVDGEPVPSLAEASRLTLRWPPFFAPTHEDRRAEADTFGALRRGGLISQDTAVRRTAATYDIGDADEELASIAADQAAADARAARQGAAVQDKQALAA